MQHRRFAQHFWITLTFAWILGLIFKSSAEVTSEQHFKVTPHDVQILEGTDTLLRCEVSARAGQVQWTKDGFALGFSAVIHGFPRYSVLVDKENGVYNLQIKNASLEDDSEYQCQVGPAPGNPAIRANAKLNIIAAPSSIAIESYTKNSKVEVIEKQNLTLTCFTENANPAASIVWYYGNTHLNGVVPKIEIKEVAPKRFKTISTIIIRPRADDDFKELSCEARHKALPPDVPMRSSIQLSVLYPPGPPFFEGYEVGETLTRGQHVQIACRSRGGNPAAQLVWYKGGIAIPSPQRTAGRLSENIYKFVAEESDNGANLVCEAKNILANKALKAELNLTVFYAPKEVTITGVTEAKMGDSLQLTCTSTPSNPASRINWSVNGHPFGNSTYKTIKSEFGGWISASNISLPIDAHSRTFVIVCHALNTELTQNVVTSHTVNVLYPPSPPLLTGYNDGDIITSGSVKKLHCSSIGGNPTPALNWFKNDKKLNAVVKVLDNKIVSELSILVNATDNNAVYKCEVRSSAIDIPLFAIKTFSVYFPPETVKISVSPKNLVPGIRAKLICDSSSSNPQAKISWWKDGIPVEGINLSTKTGLWGGAVSTLEMFVNITEELDGIVYTCQSSNEVLQRSVHETISLNILHAPKYDVDQETQFIGIEGQSLHIALQATANPSSMSYTWTRNGLPILSNNESGSRIVAIGPVLNITQISRNDSGNYVCEAMNSQGTAMLEINIIVDYAPTIESTSTENSFIIGEDAVLSCSVNAKPLSAAHVYWMRNEYNMGERTSTTFTNNTSYLHIKEVQRKDIGNFTCIADNQRGKVEQRNVLLVVQSAPELDHSPAYTRFAVGVGDRGRIVCKAFAAPKPAFVWRRFGNDIKMQRRRKFKAVENRINGLIYESILYVENASADDYGPYECVVRNIHGQASSTLELTKPTRPDTPLKLNVDNVTDDTVVLTWSPGFDGGLKAYYRLRYKLQNEDKYKYVDVRPDRLNATLDGLKFGAVYYFSVMAANEAGGSKFLPDLKLTLVKGAQPYSNELKEKDEMPNFMIIGITSAAMVLLVLNAALVAWFVIRRQNKNTSDTESPNDDAYSKDDNQSVYKLPITALQADVHKKAASTYLVENVDIIQSTAYPPKYQESSMCTSSYNTCNLDFTRTLPNPKRHSSRSGVVSDYVRCKDDQMLMSNGLYIPSPSPVSSLVIKGSYISSPSPAPPPDGSYFNMSDKYISYPPVAY